MKKKVTFFFWEGWLDVSPTLQYLIKKLNKNDFEVTFFIRDDNEYALDSIVAFEKEGVTFFRISTKNKLQILNFFLLFLRKLKLIKLQTLISFINKLIFKVEQKITSKRVINFNTSIVSIKKNCDIVICVDAIGLFLFENSNISAKNIYYLSLELGENPNVTSRLSNKIFSNEKTYFNKIEATIIQDIYRWKALKKHVGIENDKVLYLPNSATISNNIEKEYAENYFHKKFNLLPNTKIVLSAGMISKGVLSLEVSKAVGHYSFKTPIKVIFHDRISTTNNTDYLSEVYENGKKNLILSLEPLKFNEIYKIFSSAYIGLAFYKGEINDNYKFIVGASGKLYQYLKFGLPIITSNLPGFKELVDENKIGLVIDDVRELPMAIEKIEANYSFYSKNALSLFENKLNVDIFLNNIINKFKK